ncbi:uncharacterized protein LOC120353508 [Nilaparvata lugens]|uniref:uncharacterized protein LOC120353508 n=1 Tax=Nilaparvata lugens TaxID=108931 RepID=UPI00193E85AA|nr:uncharacterized protein LOC120353508 [Nilaparvata lugens]
MIDPETRTMMKKTVPRVLGRHDEGGGTTRERVGDQQEETRILSRKGSTSKCLCPWDDDDDEENDEDGLQPGAHCPGYLDGKMKVVTPPNKESETSSEKRPGRPKGSTSKHLWPWDDDAYTEWTLGPQKKRVGQKPSEKRVEGQKG